MALTNLHLGALAFLLGLVAAVPALLSLAASEPSPYPPGGRGHDISFPQCGGSYPEIQSFAVVGVTKGRAFTENPCLVSEYVWASGAAMNPSLYMNINGAFGSTAYNGNSGPAGTCQPDDYPCIAYNYGFNAASNAYAYASSVGVIAQHWWLDVETANSWWADTALNQRVVQGAADFFAHAGLTLGVYSTNYQWNLLMGSYSPNLPVWYATATGTAGAPDYCSSAYDFAGGGVVLVQYYGGDFDADYACGPSTPAPTQTLTATTTSTPGLNATETPLQDPPTPSPAITAAATATSTFTPTVTPTATLTSSPTPTDTVTPAFTATPGQLSGDANCGGTVDSIDAALVLQYGAGLLPSLACQQSADVNHDGSVDAVDAALILQRVAGLVAHF